MKQSNKSELLTSVKLSALAIALVSSVSSYASSSNEAEAKPFDCVDKTSFEISAHCMSAKIEDTMVFKNAEKKVFKQAEESNDRALATMTFDERTMTIKVVGHRDSSIAKVDTKNKD